MSKKVITQFANVFIHYFSNRSKSTTKLFISEQSRAYEEAFGRLFGIIEIQTPSRENAKIINELIADIESTYYERAAEEPSLASAFEKTLKEVNDRFTRLMAQDSASLVGNLNEYTIREKINIAVGLIHESDVHFSTLNDVGAFLIYNTNQGYKITKVGEQSGDKGAGAVRLFDTVVSGELEPGNFMFFCNRDFLNFVSKERILKTITSLPISKGADYFKNALLQHEGFNFAAIIIQSDSSSQELQNEPQSLSSIKGLQEKESHTEQLLFPTLSAKLSGFFSTKKPRPQKNTETQPGTVKKDYTAPREVNSREPRETPEPPLKKPDLVTTGFPFEKIRQHTTPLLQTLGQKIKQSVSKARSSTNLASVRNVVRLRLNQLKQKISRIPKTSRILILLFVVFGVLFAYSVVFIKDHPFTASTQSSQSQVLAEVDRTLTDAEASLIAGDNDEARRLIGLAEQELTNAKLETSADQEYSASLANKLNSLIAKLRNITLVDPTQLASLSGVTRPELGAMSHSGDFLYVFDNANGTGTRIHIKTRETAPLQGTLNGNVIRTRTIEGTTYVLTSENAFYRISGTTLIPFSVTLQSDEKATDFTLYNDRLYNIIPSRNQIYRHQPVGNDFSAGITWIQESGINLENVNSIGIDTSIWLATSDGSVMRFFKGFKQAFEVRGLEPALTSINMMIKKESSDYLYILDSIENRIVVLDTEGNVITQYFSPVLENVTAFTVDEDGKVMYVANDNQVYAILINHF